MFKKIAAEALGISDIGIIVSPQDYDKVDSDDYLFHEDGEKIFFLIKSKKDEYCFTNLALIHVDGDSAVSSKRRVKRYEYYANHFSNVSLETAGTLDMDIELKFSINEHPFSIDIGKKFVEDLKNIYKALYTIGRHQRKDAMGRDNALRCLDATASLYKLNSVESDEVLLKRYTALLDHLNMTMHDRFTKKDFGDVFETYIRA
ncbi:MAG: PH domain-containing protein [Armatimonas sp.]